MDGEILLSICSGTRAGKHRDKKVSGAHGQTDRRTDGPTNGPTPTRRFLHCTRVALLVACSLGSLMDRVRVSECVCVCVFLCMYIDGSRLKASVASERRVNGLAREQSLARSLGRGHRGSGKRTVSRVEWWLGLAWPGRAEAGRDGQYGERRLKVYCETLFAAARGGAAALSEALVP